MVVGWTSEQVQHPLVVILRAHASIPTGLLQLWNVAGLLAEKSIEGVEGRQSHTYTALLLSLFHCIEVI